MKIRSTSGMLAALLEMVSRAVSGRSTIQLLQAILFEADKEDGVLTMKATDMEISISLGAETAVEEGGRVAIPAKLLLKYAKSLPEGEVELSASPSEGTATLSCGGSSVSLRCYPPDDFPVLPAFPEDTAADKADEDTATEEEVEKDPAFSVDAAAFSEAVNKVLPFVSKDESRAVLMGVLVGFSEGAVTMAATDSYRLGFNTQKLEGAVEAAGTAIVPGRALKEAARLTDLVDEDGHIEVALTENAAMFRAKGLTLTTRLIEGNFPEYERLLPDDFDDTFLVDRNGLLTALRRVRLIADGQSPPPAIKLAFSHEPGALGGGELNLSLTAAEAGAATEALGAEVPEGTSFTIFFNPKYLAEAVASISAEQIALRVNDPLKPAVIQAPENAPTSAEDGDAPGSADNAKDDEAPAPGKLKDGHLALLMPMRNPDGKE
ncbi:MAG: DNA polymerase III subunit beta [Rubrobacteraceae bacterium]